MGKLELTIDPVQFSVTIKACRGGKGASQDKAIVAGNVPTKTGGLKSVTVIIWETVALLPEQSVTLQVRMTCPVPQILNPRILSVGILVTVMVGVQLSDAVRGCVKGKRSSQEMVIFGGAACVMTGGVVSTIVIFC